MPGEGWRQTTQPGAGEFFVLIGRIGHVGMTRLVADCFEIALRCFEQRTQQGHRATGRDPSHARQPGHARAARQPEQDGFGLIIGVMRGDDRLSLDRNGAIGEQRLTRRARPLLNARGGLVANPGQMMVRKAQLLRPVPDHFRLG